MKKNNGRARRKARKAAESRRVRHLIEHGEAKAPKAPPFPLPRGLWESILGRD